MDIGSLSSLASNHPYLRLAIVFGSVAKGTAQFDSDIDVAVWGRTPLAQAQHNALIRDMAHLTGRPVDLIDLHRVGEPLLGQILRHGRRIFGSDQDMASLMQRHVYATEDFVPGVQHMLEQRNQQWLRS